MAQLVHHPSNGSNGLAATAATRPEGATRDGDTIEDTLNQLLAGGLSSGALLCDAFAAA